MTVDPTKGFSSRVENYIKCRPGYPIAVLDLLKEECGLIGASVVADVGSGTGILTKMVLENGNRVFGIEPNREMREAAERLLSDCPTFTSVDGSAEATTLKDRSVDLITAGQAFHWFDREKARREFLRILKHDGWVALIWNDRSVTASSFLKAYEDVLMAYGTDYEAVNHKQIDAKVFGSFFGNGGFKQAAFPNEQVFDFEDLKGRVLSSSYAPEPGHPKFEPMVTALRAIFEKHQAGGKVTFQYDTTVYYGRIQ